MMESIQTNNHSTFLKIYFYLLAATTGIMVVTEGASILYSAKDILQTGFTLLGFIAFYGYTYNKRIFNRTVWLILVPLFFLWELGCYLFIPNPLLINLFIFVALIPTYWSVALYPFITLEQDHKKVTAHVLKRDRYTTKFKAIFVGLAALATLSQLFLFLVLITSLGSVYFSLGK